MTASSGNFTVGAVEIEQVPRKLRMHSVTEEELTTLRAVVPTTAVAFLGIAAGAAIAFYTALQTSGLDADTRDTINQLYIGSRVFCVFFAVIAIAGYVHLANLIREIKNRPGLGRQDS